MNKILRLRGLVPAILLVVIAGLLFVADIQAQAASDPPDMLPKWSCSDSDGGLVYDVFGTVFLFRWNYPYSPPESRILPDICESGPRLGYVREFSCNGDYYRSTLFKCPYGCADGACQPLTCTDGDGDTYAIQGGDCGPVDCDDSNPRVRPGAAENCVNGIDDNCDGNIDLADPTCTCTDSDGGLTYDVPGSVTGFSSNGVIVTRYDACGTGSTEGFIKEFYCYGNAPRPKLFRCQYGCADAACQP